MNQGFWIRHTLKSCFWRFFFAHSWRLVAPPHEDNDYEDASFLEVISVIDALEIQIQKGEFLVPLDTLRRTPVTKEELLSSTHRFHSQQDQRMMEQVN